MFSSILGPNKIAISRQLLTFLDYNPEELAVEIIKYKAVFLE